MLRRVCWTHTPPRSLLLTISNPPTPTGTPTPSSAIATLKYGCASATLAVIRVAGLGALDFASRQLADKTLVIPKVKTCQVPASSLMVHVESAIVEFEPIEATVDHPECKCTRLVASYENIPEEERVARVAGTSLRSISSALDFTCQFADMTLLMPEETVYDVQNDPHNSLPKQPSSTSTSGNGSQSFPITFPLQSSILSGLGMGYAQQQLAPPTPQTNLLVSPQAMTPHLSPPTHFTPPLLGFTITPSPHGFQPNTTPLFGTYPSFDSLTLSTPAVPIPALVFESPVPTDYFSGLGLTAPYDPYSQLLPLDMGGFTLTQGDPAAAVTGQNVTEFDFFASLMHNSTTTTATTTAGSVEPPPETPTPQITMFEQISTTFVEDVLAEHPTGSTTTIPPGLTIFFFLEHIPFLEHGRRSRKHVCMTMSQLRSLIIASHNANRSSSSARNAPPRETLHMPAPGGCTRSFTQRFNYETHLETHYPKREKKYACDVGACCTTSSATLQRATAWLRSRKGRVGPRPGGVDREPPVAEVRGWWRWFLGNGKVKVELGKEEEEEDGEEQSGSDWTGDE
ncbi:hypothetical protein BJ742DRAFT_859093 [Cladochytrium replicatum]|nr:hypothetical protein BJ742DRAFT_859093 [Cladochytrium replicatum]